MKYNLKPIDDLGNENWEEGSEVGNIVKEIRDTAFRLRTEEEIRLFIQNHQLALHNRKNDSKVSDSCDKVLYYLETYFWKFLHSKSLVSDLGREALYLEWEQEIKEAEQLLKEAINKRLWHIVDVLLNPRKVCCTIDRCDYLREFWQSWSLDFMQFYEEHDEENLIKFLISQNFNSPTFHQYLTNHISRELNQEEDPWVHEQVLEKSLKKYCTVSKRIGQQHTPNFPPIYDLLESWLLLELKLCKKKQKDFNPNQTTLRPSTVSSKKIETSLSVSQLACFFKMLHDAGIVTNQGQKEMLEIVSKTFKTQKTEAIALESLHNKYYNFEDKTKDTVIEKIKQVIK